MRRRGCRTDRRVKSRRQLGCSTDFCNSAAACPHQGPCRHRVHCVHVGTGRYSGTSRHARCSPSTDQWMRRHRATRDTPSVRTNFLDHPAHGVVNKCIGDALLYLIAATHHDTDQSACRNMAMDHGRDRLHGIRIHTGSYPSNGICSGIGSGIQSGTAAYVEQGCSHRLTWRFPPHVRRGAGQHHIERSRARRWLSPADDRCSGAEYSMGAARLQRARSNGRRHTSRRTRHHADVCRVCHTGAHPRSCAR